MMNVIVRTADVREDPLSPSQSGIPLKAINAYKFAPTSTQCHGATRRKVILSLNIASMREGEEKKFDNRIMIAIRALCRTSKFLPMFRSIIIMQTCRVVCERANMCNVDA